MDPSDIICSRNCQKRKLIAAVANGDENVARELRFLLKMEKSESLRGAPLKRGY